MRAMLTGAQSLSSLVDLPIVRASNLRSAAGSGSWQFADLIGALAEISQETPCGAISFAAEIIAEAQREREPVVWVAGTESVFFPADFCRRGIDVSAVAVIRAGGAGDSLRAAEWLVGSGAVGLVVIDAGGKWSVSEAALGRIQKRAERSRCAVLFLTRKRPRDPSLGSRILRRGFITRSGGDPFLVEIHTVRDTRSHSSSRQRRQYRGPAGMHQG
jgi:recombination protein RecA